MDAGFTLARAHYTKLVILWLGFSLPVFLLCVLMQLTLGWSLMIFVWWWFKPLYELPITLYLSKALFSEPLSIRTAWKMTLSHLWTLFKTFLGFARLSTGRSMTANVVFLEQLPRKKRGTRIQTLKLVPTRHYALMFACVNIEIIVAYAIITVIGGLLIAETTADIDWEVLMHFATESPEFTPWIVATSFTSLFAAALVAPFYVAGGFLIYINRRMQLEAWDIEHRFRRIQPRKGAATIASTVLIVLCLSTSDPSVAAERAQSLDTPAEVANQVQEILAREDFGATKTRKVPKFKNKDDDEEEDEDEDSFDSSWLDWLRDGSLSPFAVFAKGLLWTMIALFIGLLIYTLLQFKQPKRKNKNTISRVGREVEDAKNHPLTQNLPADIAAAAEHLLQRGERRQALSVLFRGALRAVMDEHDLKVSRGATESDCKQSVSSVANENQITTFSNLLGVWQKEAYANKPQQEHVIATLIEQWKQAFEARTHAATSQSGGAS